MTKFSIKKVEIQNFRSIKDKVKLNVKPGLYTIEGINCDEPNSKNGAGKSSIISAIYWCLTGTTLTNEVLADEVINEISGKDCLVTLTSSQTKIRLNLLVQENTPSLEIISFLRLMVKMYLVIK